MRYFGQSHFLDKPMAGLLWALVGLGCFLVILAGIIFPPVIIAIPAGLVWVAICLHRPFMAFCIVLFLQVFDTLLLLVPYSGSGEGSFLNTLTVTKLLLGILMLVSLLRVLLTKNEEGLGRLRAQIFYITLCLLFILGCFPGLIYSELNGDAFRFLSSLCACVLLGFLGIAFVRDFRALCCVFASLLPAFIITGIIGVWEVTTETYLVQELGREVSQTVAETVEGGQFRVVGPSGDPVFYAVSMMLAITTALVVIQMVRHWALRLICLLALGLFSMSLFSTASRGGLIGTVILGAVFFLLAKIRGKWLMALGAGVAAVLILGIYTFAVSELAMARYLGLAGADTATDNRMGFYTQCLRMSQDSPVFGVGLGQFNELQVNTYFDSRTPRRPYAPHNVYLQILAETGPVTLAIYITIIGTCIFRLLPRVLATQDPCRRNVGAAILGCVLGLGFFASNTNLRENEMVWLMFALAIVAAEVFREIEADEPVTVPARWDPSTREPSGLLSAMQGPSHGA